MQTGISAQQHPYPQPLHPADGDNNGRVTQSGEQIPSGAGAGAGAGLHFRSCFCWLQALPVLVLGPGDHNPSSLSTRPLSPTLPTWN